MDDMKRWANLYYSKAGKFASMDQTMRDMARTYDWPASVVEYRIASARASAGRFMENVRR